MRVNTQRSFFLYFAKRFSEGDIFVKEIVESGVKRQSSVESGYREDFLDIEQFVLFNCS
jgi:hypothetical protein